jgi:hypothetical protein
MNRLKILGAFENLPNIIEMAKNKQKTFKPDSKDPKSLDLHIRVEHLQTTLLRILPILIDKLVPGTLSKLIKER